MYLNESLLQAVWKGEAQSFLKEGERLRREMLGELWLPTGRVVANDPCCLFEQAAFIRTVPPGRYLVSIWVWEDAADKRVAFAELRFSGKPPVRFEMALVEGQDVSRLPEDGFYGYGVDSGTGGYMDEETCTLLSAWIKASDMYDYPALAEALDESYVHTYSTANVSLPDSGHNVAAFSSGFGDGAYPSYWGIAQDGTPCCLITDFLVIDG